MKIRCDESRLEEEAATLRNQIAFVILGQDDHERFTDLGGQIAGGEWRFSLRLRFRLGSDQEPRTAQK
jgi:hypothetical protein